MYCNRQGVLMTYLDITFCASPKCENKCGKKLTAEQLANKPEKELISYAYFCGRGDIFMPQPKNQNYNEHSDIKAL